MLEINKVYCMDALEFLKKIDDKSVNLVCIDPPYNIKKDSWDKIEDYENWLKAIILELQRVLKDNGSFYMFHSKMEVVADFMQWLRKDTNFIFKQFIVWNKRFDEAKNKGFLDGYVVVEGLRNYQQMAEYILFYTFQDDDYEILNQVCFKNYIKYMRLEKEKIGWTTNKFNEYLGRSTIASHWFSYTQHRFINELDYSSLQKTGFFKKPYSELKSEYWIQRKENENVRYGFNNQKTHHSVWNYELVSKKNNHATPKPLELIKNIILHSSKDNQIVLDCFMGTGTVALVCKQLNRNFIGCDNKQEYIDEINKKLSQSTL